MWRKRFIWRFRWTLILRWTFSWTFFFTWRYSWRFTKRFTKNRPFQACFIVNKTCHLKVNCIPAMTLARPGTKVLKEHWEPPARLGLSNVEGWQQVKGWQLVKGSGGDSRLGGIQVSEFYQDILIIYWGWQQVEGWQVVGGDSRLRGRGAMGVTAVTLGKTTHKTPESNEKFLKVYC